MRTNDAAREILGSRALEGGREHPLLDGASDLQQWCERDLVRDDGRRLVLSDSHGSLCEVAPTTA